MKILNSLLDSLISREGYQLKEAKLREKMIWDASTLLNILSQVASCKQSESINSNVERLSNGKESRI